MSCVSLTNLIAVLARCGTLYEEDCGLFFFNDFVLTDLGFLFSFLCLFSEKFPFSCNVSSTNDLVVIINQSGKLCLLRLRISEEDRSPRN